MQVNESIVRAVKAPQGTETWNPFPHAVLLDELEFVRNLAELNLSSHRYELNESGSKFFGMWNFEQPQWSERTQVSIGFRNSIDKSLSLGLTAGTFVTVCSNMAFSGEWIHFRKHTKNVLEDLHYFILQAFGVCLKRGRREAVIQDEMEIVPLSDKEWKCLTYDALEQKIIPPTKSIELFNPTLERTVGVWFNSVTNILSRRSLLSTEDQYTKLRQLVGAYVQA